MPAKEDAPPAVPAKDVEPAAGTALTQPAVEPAAPLDAAVPTTTDTPAATETLATTSVIGAPTATTDATAPSKVQRSASKSGLFSFLKGKENQHEVCGFCNFL